MINSYYFDRQGRFVKGIVEKLRKILYYGAFEGPHDAKLDPTAEAVGPSRRDHVMEQRMKQMCILKFNNAVSSSLTQRS